MKELSAILMVSLMSILLMAGTASAAHTLLKEDTFWNLTMVHKWPMSAASLSLKTKAEEAGAAQKAQAAIAIKEAAEKAAKAEKETKAAKTAAEKEAAQSKQQSDKAKETAKQKNVGNSKPAAAKTSASKNTSIITTPGGKTYKFKKQLSMQATAYTAAASENGKWGAVDYFGNKLKVGTVAVDPKVIPLGTKLYITGYKYASLPKGGMIAIASDMGGAIKGNRMDVFVPDSSREAQAFGIQQLKVYIIE